MTKASKTINLKKTENVKINTKFKYYNSIKIVLKTTQVFIITISHAWSAIFIYFFLYQIPSNAFWDHLLCKGWIRCQLYFRQK